MTRSAKRRKNKSSVRKQGSRRSMDPARRRHVLAMVGMGIAFGVLLVSGQYALGRLETHVNQKLVQRSKPSLVFADLPDRLAIFAEADLRGGAVDLLQGDWMAPERCQQIAERLAGVGWVAKIKAVRRQTGGRFEVSCAYRTPAAMVQSGEHCYLIDRTGTRLPGIYVYDPSWPLIQGVSERPSPPGTLWPGRDVIAGLAVIDRIKSAPFAAQITAVDVTNFAGRTDGRRTHIELVTDRAGGRIRWGSAPGMELEENTVPQKIAILTQNLLQTGRADAGNAVIDVSVYPDRFTIPAP